MRRGDLASSGVTSIARYRQSCEPGALVGLAALVPFGRRVLRGLAPVFGLGAGLVFDESALFWNLNPEYPQRSSPIAADISAVVQLA